MTISQRNDTALTALEVLECPPRYCGPLRVKGVGNPREELLHLTQVELLLSIRGQPRLGMVLFAKAPKVPTLPDHRPPGEYTSTYNGTPDWKPHGGPKLDIACTQALSALVLIRVITSAEMKL